MYNTEPKEIKVKDVKTLFKLLHKRYITDKVNSKFEISPQWGQGFLVRETQTYKTINLKELEDYEGNLTI